MPLETHGKPLGCTLGPLGSVCRTDSPGIILWGTQDEVIPFCNTPNKSASIEYATICTMWHVTSYFFVLHFDTRWTRMILLMEVILHHLGCIKPCKYWDIYHINWCRISAIPRDGATYTCHDSVFLLSGWKWWGQLPKIPLCYILGVLGHNDQTNHKSISTRLQWFSSTRQRCDLHLKLRQLLLVKVWEPWWHDDGSVDSSRYQWCA